VQGVGDPWHDEEPSGSLPGGGALACLPTVVVPGPLPTQGAQAKASPTAVAALANKLPGGQGAAESGHCTALCATNPNTVWVAQTAKLPKAPAMARGDLGMRESAIRAPRDFPFPPRGQIAKSASSMSSQGSPGVSPAAWKMI